MARIKQVWQVYIKVNDIAVFDGPVEVRRPSELNGVVSNHLKSLEVGDTAEVILERII